MFTPAEADQELKTGAQLCPGPWEQHSMSVAQNARLIAEKTGCMDCDKAYVEGLMHDIARICLTHSFPLKGVNTFFREI